MLVPYRVAAIHSSGKQGGTTDLFYLPCTGEILCKGSFVFKHGGEESMKMSLMKERWQA